MALKDSEQVVAGFLCLSLITIFFMASFTSFLQAGKIGGQKRLLHWCRRCCALKRFSELVGISLLSHGCKAIWHHFFWYMGWLGYWFGVFGFFGLVGQFGLIFLSKPFNNCNLSLVLFIFMLFFYFRNRLFNFLYMIHEFGTIG